MNQLLSSLVCLWLLHTVSAAPSCGDDWHPYKDEKCFRILPNFVTHDEAQSLCAGLIEAESSIPLLLTVRSAEEQEFVTNLIFRDSQVVDNVWLGAIRVNETTTDFQWADGTALEFTNWHEGNPSNLTGHDCTIMMPAGIREADKSKAVEDGLWADVFCNRSNVVVCQKLQPWTYSQLQRILIEVRKTTNENQVPIGFVYVQLPDQDDPSIIWPRAVFDEITSKYAGYFFRAEGGDSEKFGVPQADFAPKIQNVHYEGCLIENDPVCASWYPGYVNMTLPANGRSPIIFAGRLGAIGSTHNEALSFTVAGGETRPRNLAIRIWQRVK